MQVDYTEAESASTQIRRVSFLPPDFFWGYFVGCLCHLSLLVMWCTWTIDAHTYVSSRLIMYDAAKKKGGERITHMPHTAWKKPFCYSRQRAQVIDSPRHVRAKLISQVPKRLFCVPNAKKWRCHGWGRSDQLCLPTPKPTLLMQPATT